MALGSGTAFLVAQLIDVAVFERLRAGSWWRAPLVSTLVSSTLDTAIFFLLAFAGALDVPGARRMTWPGRMTTLPLLGPWTGSAPLWVSLAVADWGVKLTAGYCGIVAFPLGGCPLARKRCMKPFDKPENCATISDIGNIRKEVIQCLE